MFHAIKYSFLLVCSFAAAAAFAGGGREAPPEEVNVSYVRSPFNLQIMTMRERGLLEKRFGEKGVAVKWHDIESGAHQTEAMAAGSLDIASVVNGTSVILANAAGNRVEIAAIVSRPKRSFAILAGPRGPDRVGELRGRTVAGPKGTVLHQLLAAALVAEGMSLADVKFVSMGLPEARTALLAGRVDAALQAASLIIRGEEAGLRVLCTADGYLTPLLVSAVRPDFAEKRPALLRVYLDAQKEAAAWIGTHPGEAAAIGARIHGISEDDARKLSEWNGMASVLEKSDLKAMEADVEFLLWQGMIARKVDPADFTLPAAFGGS